MTVNTSKSASTPAALTQAAADEIVHAHPVYDNAVEDYEFDASRGRHIYYLGVNFDRILVVTSSGKFYVKKFVV